MIPWSSLSMASGSRMKNRKSAQISINQHQSASISINQSKIISTIRYCGSLTWVSWLAVRADRVTPHGVVDRHERCQPHTISHKSTRTHKQRACDLTPTRQHEVLDGLRLLLAHPRRSEPCRDLFREDACDKSTGKQG